MSNEPQDVIRAKRYAQDISRACKHVKMLFTLCEVHEITPRTVIEDAGLERSVVTRWCVGMESLRRPSVPNVEDLEACYNALGYTLVPMPVEDALGFVPAATKNIVRLPRYSEARRRTADAG